MGRMFAPRSQPRTPTIDPDSGEGREIGMSVRMQGGPSPIPGGAVHVTNAPVHRQKTPAPDAPPEIKPINAHGVPPGSATTRDRADMERGTNGHHSPRPAYRKDYDPEVVPVPVYVVPMRGGPRPLRTAVPRHILVTGFDHDPICICGQDPNRTKIRLMNNDAANNIRIARDPTSLLVDPGSGNSRTIGGSLLPHGMTGYQDFETQDELWAIAVTASTAVELQIVMETSIPGAG